MKNEIWREVYRGDRLALQVLDRDAVRFCVHAEPYAVISITDPVEKHPILISAPQRRGVLRLKFYDVDHLTRLSAVASRIGAFTPEMARQVVQFVRDQMTQGTGLFVVHCEAGVSRSAGVAAALSRFFNHDETPFLVFYRPNPWVRKLVLEALAETTRELSPNRGVDV